jgi:hypothetical protein
MREDITGGCLCGAVRYVARGQPINVRVCHCRMCQKAVGAAFNARALFPRAAVRLDGPIATFASSPDLTRGFCPRCGTTLYSARASLDAIGLTCGGLDDPAALQPSMHIWMSSKQPWVRLDDGLPQYPKAAP